MKATLAFPMDFGIFLVVFGKTFVTLSWISSMRSIYYEDTYHRACAFLSWRDYHSLLVLPFLLQTS
eukprot:4678564-Amphidinium_carterae.1